MSTAAYGPRYRRERMPRLGHHAWWLQMAFNGLIAIWVLASYLPRLFSWQEGGVGDAPEQGWLVVLLAGAAWIAFVFAVLGFLIYKQVRHDHKLCALCAAKTPLDPQTVIQRKTFWLRSAHKHFRRFWTWMFAVVLLAAVLQLIFGGPVLISFLVIALWNVHFQINMYATEVHRRLYSWCPYCRRRKRWEDDGVPEPSPTPTGTRDLTDA